MYLLFDIGGTNMRFAGLKRGEKKFSAIEKRETPANDFEAGILMFQEVAKYIAGGEKIEGVVGGIAGPLDKEKGCLLNSPNLRDWIGKPLKNKLEEIFAASVIIENDASLVGLGEAHYGAGRGSKILGYMTVSTGIGGVRIVDGKIDKNAFGFEPGHQIVGISESICPTCGVESDLESLVSGTAIEQRYKQKPAEITDPAVWTETAHVLAFGLNNLAVFWSPDTIVLGGSMIFKRPGIDIEEVRKHFESLLTIFPQKPILKRSELEDDGGLYGAMHLTNSI